MRITYLDTGDRKLISYFRHDYKTHDNKKGHWMIDGGADNDYFRCGVPETVLMANHLLKGDISELIEFIREDLLWGQNYDEKNQRLPDTKYVHPAEMTTGHIIGVIAYLNNRKKDRNEYLIDIFVQELAYRERNNLL